MDTKSIDLNPFRAVPVILRFLIAAVIMVGRFVVNFLSTQWHSYNPLGQFLFTIALFAISVDAAVAYQYGDGMSKLHAMGFAVVAVAFCILPDVAIEAFRAKRFAMGAGLSAGVAFLGLVALQSHLGYGGGIRLTHMQQTGFQNAVATDVRKSAASEEQNLAAWRATLETKKTDLADLKAAAGWVTSITPEAIESEIATLRERLAAEEKGQRGRKAGRGKEFEGIQNRITKLEKDLAPVKRFNALSDEIAALERDIKTTQAIVDAKFQKVADTGFTSNVVVNQNDIAAALVNFILRVPPEQAIKPTEVQRVVANTLITGFNSLGFLICAPLLQIAAGLNRRRNVMRGDDEDHVESGAPEGAPAGDWSVPNTSLSDKYGALFAEKYGATA